MLAVTETSFTENWTNNIAAVTETSFTENWTDNIAGEAIMHIWIMIVFHAQAVIMF